MSVWGVRSSDLDANLEGSDPLVDNSPECLMVTRELAGCEDRPAASASERGHGPQRYASEASALTK